MFKFKKIYIATHAAKTRSGLQLPELASKHNIIVIDDIYLARRIVPVRESRRLSIPALDQQLQVG